ncbi:MAG: apolipoprotein N-acyltransferase [Rhodospirillaceae bacterium]
MTSWATAPLHLLQTAHPALRAGLACGLGALATLAMPPWHIWPVLWVSLPLFLFLVQSAKTYRGAFLIGWAFGLGHFTTGFGWIGNAFFVDAETFAALAVPAIGALAAGFALYTGIVALVTRVVIIGTTQTSRASSLLQTTCRLWVFAIIWTFIEWWRGWFLTGFPWNPIGSSWTDVSTVLQSVSVMGVYGLSFVTVLAASASLLLIDNTRQMTRWLIIALCHAPLIASAVYGAARLDQTNDTSVPDVRLRLVQPNIAQVDKWLPGLREKHLYEQVRMSTENAVGITHVLWAETAVPFPLNLADSALQVTAQAAPPSGLVLTGAPRIEGQGTTRTAYNSFFAVERSGKIAAVYDKSHLVPFGEYTPLQNLIPIPQFTGGIGFTPGLGKVTIALPGLPAFSPLICYEIVFPGAVTNPEKRPKWLFNLTNDAWFGSSSGPYQHIATAQMRAVEEGLPVVRVANTGISAVIDGYGRIRSSLPLGQKGVLDSPLPADLAPTPFSRFGHSPTLIIIILSGFLALFISRHDLQKYRVNVEL